jgi:hypothetical protein
LTSKKELLHVHDQLWNIGAPNKQVWIGGECRDKNCDRTKNAKWWWLSGASLSLSNDQWYVYGSKTCKRQPCAGKSAKLAMMTDKWGHHTGIGQPSLYAYKPTYKHWFVCKVPKITGKADAGLLSIDPLSKRRAKTEGS